MTGKFPNGLKVAMEQAKIGPTELARLIGKNKQDVSRWQRGERKLTAPVAQVIAPHLHVEPESLIFPDRSPGAAGRPHSGDEQAAFLRYGQVLGGRADAFPFDDDYAERITPPRILEGVRGAYAAYVVGDSMEPRYNAGETVYVNPRQPPRKNDYVVVQLHPEEGGPVLAYVKRLVSAWPARILKLEQHNPRKTMEFPQQRVKAVHRIVMGGES